MVSINKLQNEFSYSFNEIGIILNLSSFVYINNIYGTNNKTLVLHLVDRVEQIFQHAFNYNQLFG